MTFLPSIVSSLCLLTILQYPTGVTQSVHENRVGGGVTPAASHTTGHTVPYHGGSLR
ncbi:MAG: hypothetical protein GQ556_05680 [Desulfobacterales bacterium]|nr:hypothetical protein [Desulfobacterales bacterium]